MQHPDVTDFIQRAPEEQRAILEEIRQLIFSTVPNATEQFKWKRPVYALEKDFCYVKTTKKHVTFGFFEADKIQTNQHLLEGTGKQMRHLKILRKEDLADYQISKMIEEVISDTK